MVTRHDADLSWHRGQPIFADEWDFHRSKIDWLSNRALIQHPQACIHFARLNLAVFGQSIGSARLAGVFSAIVSLWLISILIYYTWRNHPVDMDE